MLCVLISAVCGPLVGLGCGSQRVASHPHPDSILERRHGALHSQRDVSSVWPTLRSLVRGQLGETRVRCGDHARTTCEISLSTVASLRSMEALVKRMRLCFSLMSSSTFSSSAFRPTSAEAVIASSSASSPARRCRKALQVSSSFPIASRSSCTYSRQRPRGLEDWHSVWIEARSALTSVFEGSLPPVPAALPFLPKIIPLLLSASSASAARSLSSPLDSISSFASSRLRTSRPWPCPLGSLSIDRVSTASPVLSTSSMVLPSSS
mmetsp:Transcript_49894/g.99296  ORF Transcript_49894/g.99296 Transcript_49894/m.99296 type:complete len:265 (-) Transcript_49894:787-1581(-)